MSDRQAILRAKQLLPLPELMKRRGLGDHAKQSARCPFHKDKDNSFSVYKNDADAWAWKCFSTCGSGDEITLLEKIEGIDNKAATRMYLEAAGIGQPDRTARETKNTPPPFDWQQCVAEFRRPDAERIAAERGYTLDFVLWLNANGLIGSYGGLAAFPLRAASGAVVGCHYVSEFSWGFHPKGNRLAPIILGDVATADAVFVFESQWDAFAVADKVGLHTAEPPPLAFIITRGAANGRLVKGLIPAGQVALAWKQNDEEKNGKRAGDEWLKAVAASAGVETRWVKTPAPHKDANDWTRAGATADDLFAAVTAAEPVIVEPGEQKAAQATDEPRRPMLEFLSPSAMRAFVPPPGWNLVGNYHIQRGSPFVVGGAPGVGKSRVATALAVAGATGAGADWLGFEVHTRFRTMILQAENGRVRLRDEFAELTDPAYDDFIRVCAPPPFGFAFDHPDFAAQLAAAVAEFEPDVFIVDPWNRATADDKSKDYLSTFERLLAMLPTGDKAPALGIIAHTRKPQTNERSSGRTLLNILAGGYALGSVPRSAFVLQHASDEPTETQVVFTCCKNNDGELGERTAWVRGNGLFLPVADFDWPEFDRPPENRRTITGDDLEAIFKAEAGGWALLSKKEAVQRLEERTDCKQAACYRALELEGKFKARLREKSGLLTLK